MQLFEFLDLPIILNNETYDIETSERLVAFKNGLQSDREVIFLNEDQLDQCHEFKPKKYICQDDVIRKLYENKCLPNLYQGNLSGCSIWIPNETKPSFVCTSGERSVILSLPKETEVAITCPNKSDSSVQRF